jgi:hypothetical protein
LLDSGEAIPGTAQGGTKQLGWHQQTGREVVSLEFVPIAGYETRMGFVNVSIGEHSINVTRQKVVSELVRNAEMLKSEIVDVGGVGDAVLLA